jgi:glycosyltransferase involved in cell wall biosynthesis
MRVIHFSALGADTGAGRAARNIHSSVLHAGCDSWMLVENASGIEPRIANGRSFNIVERFRRRLVVRKQDGVLRRLNPNAIFSVDEVGRFDSRYAKFPVAPDIIHLHWVAGFLNSAQISSLWDRFKVPIVWTVMDCAPFTGGCHYLNGCEAYAAKCGNCPVLASADSSDVSRRSLQSKLDALRHLPITLSGATQWVADRASRSSLFSHLRYVKIPYGVDSQIFRPRPKDAVRQALGLPVNSRVVFFGATDHSEPRKGMTYAVEALNLLAAQQDSASAPLFALIAGKSDGTYASRLHMDFLDLGELHDDRLLAMAYQAADVFLCPSVDDAGPQMIPESLMCGTPVVAFQGCGGVPDFLRVGVNGYVALDRDVKDLAQGLGTVLSSVASGKINNESCRAIALQECTMEIQGSRYKTLYQELLEKSAT